MKTALLIAVVSLGLALRLISLSHFPPGFTPDEAAFGYNAYSLLQTGRDEWGIPFYRLPITNLRSFGDYKLPLYAFLAVPSVWAFGLTEFSTRLPNALLGGLSIIAIYLLVRELCAGQKHIHNTPLWAAFLLAISPWHISLSRGAFEANLVCFFLPLALYLYFAGKLKSSALFFALSFYSYHTARFLTPAVLAMVCIFFPRPKSLLVRFLLLTGLLLSPGILSFFSGSLSRAADVGIFSPTDNWAALSGSRFTARVSGMPDSLARVFYNKPVFVWRQFIHNYLSYFSPQFLFTTGAGEGTYGAVPGHGLLYLLQLPLLAAFVASLIFSPTKSKFFLVGLILVSPLPAALAKGVGAAANRAVVTAPLLAVASAFGLGFLLKLSPKLNFPRQSLVLLLFLASLVSFLEVYRFHSPALIGESMLFGMRDAITRALPISADYSEVILSRSLSEPHIYLAFYARIDPEFYQAASRSWTDFERLGFKFLDQYEGYALGKFKFGSIHPRQPVTVPTLLVGLTREFPEASPNFFQVYSPAGDPVIQVSAAPLL